MKILKLKWFLYFLGMKLFYRNSTSVAFQRVIAGKDLVVQLLVRDQLFSHCFCINNGQVMVMAGQHPAPSLVLAFANIYCANEILCRHLSNMPKLIYYINKGVLTVEGDIGCLIWFSALCEWAMEGQNASVYSA